jgi:TPR repeat protein
VGRRREAVAVSGDSGLRFDDVERFGSQATSPGPDDRGGGAAPDVALTDKERALERTAPQQPAAAFTLGLRLKERGELTAAEYWLRRAAEAGDIAAAYNLGALLADRGDLDQARRWLQIAAAGGEPLAQPRLDALEG